MKIYIGSDHGGFELKKEIIEYLKDQEENFEDLGPYELDPTDDYPDYAKKVAEKVSEAGMNENFEHNAFGILICRSGNGMVIAANKIKGAYAALCFGEKHAQKAREDDNANILCLNADYEGEDVKEIVTAFLNTKFEGKETRHGRRFEKVMEMEG